MIVKLRQIADASFNPVEGAPIIVIKRPDDTAGRIINLDGTRSTPEEGLYALDITVDTGEQITLHAAFARNVTCIAATPGSVKESMRSAKAMIDNSPSGVELGEGTHISQGAVAIMEAMTAAPDCEAA